MELTTSQGGNIFTFSNKDVKGVQISYNDAVVVSMTVTKDDVKIILVDNGSFTNILFYDTFLKMKLSLDRLKKVTPHLMGSMEALLL